MLLAAVECGCGKNDNGNFVAEETSIVLKESMMKHRLQSIATALLALLLCLSGIGASGIALAQDQKAEETEGWIQLFNGQDLTGWTPKIRYYDLGELPSRVALNR